MRSNALTKILFACWLFSACGQQNTASLIGKSGLVSPAKDTHKPCDEADEISCLTPTSVPDSIDHKSGDGTTTTTPYPILTPLPTSFPTSLPTVAGIPQLTPTPVPSIIATVPVTPLPTVEPTVVPSAAPTPLVPVETSVPMAKEEMYANTGLQLFAIKEKGGGFESRLIGNFNIQGGIVPMITDIAVSLTGKIYAIEMQSGSIYLVNPSTAALTFVIKVPIIGANALTVLSDGRLVAAGSQGVMFVDTSTGTFTTIPGTEKYISSGDIVGVPNGKLYWTVLGGVSDNLVVIDTKSGQVQNKGAIGIGSVYGIGYYANSLYGFSVNESLFKIDMDTGKLVGEIFSLEKNWLGATTNPIKW